MRDLTTCHHSPWALVRRCGDTPGKRQSTRMAYLTGTIAPNGTAIALKGFVMSNDLTNWTKHPVRIEWSDIIKQWRRRPDVHDVALIKSKLPIVEALNALRYFPGRASDEAHTNFAAPRASR